MASTPGCHTLAGTGGTAAGDDDDDAPTFFEPLVFFLLAFLEFFMLLTIVLDAQGLPMAAAAVAVEVRVGE